MKFLKKLFPSSKPAAAPAPEASLSLASEIPAQHLPLWELFKQRQLLEVKLGSANRVYQSMILALDFKRGLVWLDDLFPQQLMLEVGDELSIRHHRQGEQLLIRAQVVALGSSYGATGIAIELPQQLAYTPRRAAARFQVASDTPTMVKIRTLGQEPCFGTLQDISSGGLRLNVPGNLLPQLRHGVQLPLCEFQLHEDLHIQCRARVCAFRIQRAPYRCTQISVEFVDLPVSKRVAIENYLQQAQGTGKDNRFRAA